MTLKKYASLEISGLEFWPNNLARRLLSCSDFSCFSAMTKGEISCLQLYLVDTSYGPISLSSVRKCSSINLSDTDSDASDLNAAIDEKKTTPEQAAENLDDALINYETVDIEKNNWNVKYSDCFNEWK